MGNNINLNDITTQIQEYVRLIKQRKTHSGTTVSEAPAKEIFSFNNDLRSNIHQLNGSNKFSIQKFTENQKNTPSSKYASEAYEHLSAKENKQKVIIDLMHKNNRNYDVKA